MTDKDKAAEYDRIAEHMQRARDFASAAIRPSTLAAEFSTSERIVTKDEVVEAIAKALLPFIEARQKRCPQTIL